MSLVFSSLKIQSPKTDVSSPTLRCRVVLLHYFVKVIAAEELEYVQALAKLNIARYAPMENILSISLKASNVSPQGFHDFEKMAKVCHEYMVSFATEVGMPKRIELILAENFDEVVSDILGKSDTASGRFSSARPHGCVVGKNIVKDDSWDHVVIVFNATFWDCTANSNSGNVLLQLGLIAHELAHPYIDRMRFRSGAVKVATTDALELNVRNLSRLIIDEYFADLIADAIVVIATRKPTDAGVTPVHMWDILGTNQIDTLRTYLTDNCAALPNYANEYRANKITFQVMWGEILSGIEQLFTIYIHARAFADATKTEIPIFDSPEIQAVPFVQKYIPKSSMQFLDQLRKYRPPMSLGEWHNMEAVLLPAGEKSFLEIWELLCVPKIPTPPSLLHLVWSYLMRV